MLNRKEKRKIRKARIKKKIRGTAKRPRLSVFKSSRHIFAQLIDDEKNNVIAFAASWQIKKSKVAETKNQFQGKKAIAFLVGKILAERALQKKIKEIVFDRGGWPYHGRIRALAEGAREGGLKF